VQALVVLDYKHGDRVELDFVEDQFDNVELRSTRGCDREYRG